MGNVLGHLRRERLVGDSCLVLDSNWLTNFRRQHAQVGNQLELHFLTPITRYYLLSKLCGCLEGSLSRRIPRSQPFSNEKIGLEVLTWDNLALLAQYQYGPIHVAVNARNLIFRSIMVLRVDRFHRESTIPYIWAKQPKLWQYSHPRTPPPKQR